VLAKNYYLCHAPANVYSQKRLSRKVTFREMSVNISEFTDVSQKVFFSGERLSGKCRSGKATFQETSLNRMEYSSMLIGSTSSLILVTSPRRATKLSVAAQTSCLVHLGGGLSLHSRLRLLPLLQSRRGRH